MAGRVVDRCWIRSDYLFDYRCAIFTVSHREAEAFKIRSLMTLKQGDAQAIEWELNDLIRIHRPELAGGQLVKITATWLTWELYYIHESLPVAEDGSEPQRIPLIPPPNEAVAVPTFLTPGSFQGQGDLPSPIRTDGGGRSA